MADKEITIGAVLTAWAEWRVRYEGGGMGATQFGYDSSPKGGCGLQAWAGIDQDSTLIMSAVDSAVSSLPLFQGAVVIEWYTKARDMPGMLRRLGIKERGFYNYLRDAQAMLVVSIAEVMATRGIGKRLHIVQ